MSSTSAQNEVAEGTNASSQDADLAQAFKEVTRGEKTASALEHQLTSLEQKIDGLLAETEDSSDTAAHMLSGNQTVIGEKSGT